MIIILAGSIGRFPVGGQAWCEMQYLLGLRDLGHQVFYLEECGEGSWVYNCETQQVTTDLDYPTAYVRECLEPIGFGGHWIYRAGSQSEGMEASAFRDVCSQADLLIVRGCTIPLWRSEYDLPRRRIFIDSDPGFIQFGIANGDVELANTVARCERLFTIGQRIGAADCPIPTLDKHWLKTVFPVALSHWPLADDRSANDFTTILQWRSYKDLVYGGMRYGNKDKEFPKFLDLPLRTTQLFRIALTGGPADEISRYGWKVVEGWVASKTPSSYQTFIADSRAEFGIAKHGYVATRSGWFSDRSICYLASGRPILIQDTGIGDWLPVGEGVLTFRDMSEALQKVEAINADYERHRRAARQLAREYFAAERVLPPLLGAAMA
jgi:hypothetical protein